MEEKKKEDNFNKAKFPVKESTDKVCPGFSRRTPYGVNPFCRDCVFVVVGERPSIDIGKMKKVYMCANDNGNKSVDSNFYVKREIEFYNYCGKGYKDKNTGENFDEKSEFLRDLYFNRCKYISEKKDFYVADCKKNNIDLYYFYKDFYWWEEIHKKYFEGGGSVYNYQKFELVKSLYYMMVDRIGE